MQSVLVTGSNRGLGLEFVRQYAAAGWRVFATCRHPSEAGDLQALAGRHDGISLHRLDVTSPEDVQALVWELAERPIDVLLSNAGIYLDKGLKRIGGLRYDEWLRTFETNTLGGIRMVEALADNLAAGERRLVAVMSSHMGSIADIEAAGSYYYRSSKAALNAAMQGLAVTLRERGIGVLLMHPGGVRTRMGPPHGIPPDESVAGLRRLIDGFTMEQTGRFFRFDGTEMPW